MEAVIQNAITVTKAVGDANKQRCWNALSAVGMGRVDPHTQPYLWINLLWALI